MIEGEVGPSLAVVKGGSVLVSFLFPGASLTGVLKVFGDPMRPAIADGGPINESLSNLDRVGRWRGPGVLTSGTGRDRGAIVGSSKGFFDYCTNFIGGNGCVG